MNDEEKKAIDKVKVDISRPLACEEITICDVDDLIKIINLIQKQEKVIDEMAMWISDHSDCPLENEGIDIDCEKRCSNEVGLYKECWKQFFYRKVEEDE